MGPLIVEPATSGEFVAELRAAANAARQQGKAAVGEALDGLATKVERASDDGGDVQPLLVRARLELGYAGKDPELLYDAGGTVAVQEAAQMLRISAEAVGEMIRDGQVLVVRMFNEVLLPRLQFADGGGRCIRASPA